MRSRWARSTHGLSQIGQFMHVHNVKRGTRITPITYHDERLSGEHRQGWFTNIHEYSEFFNFFCLRRVISFKIKI